MADRKKNRSPQKLLALSRRELVARLSAAEEALRAIRSGEVDAIVVNGQGGEKVFTLQGADHTYRVFVERMNEGAAVLSSDHTVLHCNRRFAQLLGARLPSVIGSAMEGMVWPDDRATLAAAYRFCERTRNRWYLVKGAPGDSLPQGDQLVRLARSLDTSPAELREQYRRVTRRARQVVERLFYGRAA